MTTGLQLRTLKPADCETLLSWVDSRDALTQWSGPWDFHWPLDREQLLGDLRAAGRERLMLGVHEPGGPLVGHGMLTLRADHRIGLISRILVAPDCRGRGVGSRLVGELVRIGFDQHRLHRLQLGVYDFNVPAIACYQRLGFVIEGTLRHSALGSDGFWTSFVMALREPDFRGADDPGSVGVAGDGAPLIRRARLDDAGVLAGLLTQLGYPHEPRAARARLIDWSGDTRGAILIAELEDAVAGFVAVQAIRYIERPGSFARVVALAADERRRRQGIGSRLLAAAEEWARARGCSELELTSSRRREEAHPFYRASGYADTCSRSARYMRSLPLPG